MNDSMPIKVVLLGDSGVGKTSIIQRFTEDIFKSNNVTTKSANFVCKNFILPEEDTKVRFQIWDTAGQEKYHSLATMYYKDAAVAIAVFDMTSEKTLIHIKTWIKELKEKVTRNVHILILGNKADLVEQQKVNIDKVKIYSNEVKAKFFIVSAKENMNIHEAFSYAAKRVLESKGQSSTYKDSFVLNREELKKLKRKNCC